jgi:hypothetical protein
METGPIPCGLTAREVRLPWPAQLAIADETATCAFFENRSFSCWSGACVRCRSWLRTQSVTGFWDGLVGKPWRVQAVTGGNLGGLGGVLFDGGSVQLFSGTSFAVAIDSGSPSAPPPKSLTLAPPVEPRCGRASRPLPVCSGVPATALDAFPDEVAKGKAMQFRARLGESGIDAYSIDSVRPPALIDRNGRWLLFDLAGGRRFDCNGYCCDFEGMGVKVLATGVVQTSATGVYSYWLTQTRLCRIPN